MKIKRKYYLYRHIRIDKNIPFYVGIGTFSINYKNTWKKEYKYKRAFTKQSGRNFLWKRITNKVNYKVEIIYESNNKKEILKKEKYFIKLYGRLNLQTGSLCNLTDGGERNLNRIYTPSMRKKLSLASHWKDKLGNDNPKSKKVYQFDKNGVFINSFNGVREAARLTNSCNVAICNSIIKNKNNSKGSYSSNGYLWSYNRNEKFNIVDFIKYRNQCKSVICYDKNKNKLKEYYSIAKACRELKLNDSNIIKSCKSNFKLKTGGYYWKYKNI